MLKFSHFFNTFSRLCQNFSSFSIYNVDIPKKSDFFGIFFEYTDLNPFSQPIKTQYAQNKYFKVRLHYRNKYLIVV